jgi:hypothetical protein
MKIEARNSHPVPAVFVRFPAVRTQSEAACAEVLPSRRVRIGWTQKPVRESTVQ